MAEKTLSLVILFGFMTLVAISQAVTNPGIRLRLTDKGLQYVDEIAIKVLVAKIQSATIPDISGDADTPLGSVSYSLSSVHFTSLSIPSSTMKTDPGVGLTLQISGASASLSGNWHYREDHWPHISGGGSFDLAVSGLAITLSVKIGADSKGHPTISTAGCTCSVSSVKIEFHGGASWLYNLFDKYVDDKLKGVLQDKLCSEATDVINNNAAKALATFPVKKQIDKYAIINYSLLSNPNFTETYADVFVKGEFQSATAPKEAPFSPAPLPPESESDKMAYAWVTDYVINTAGLVYHEAGAFNRTVTPSDLPPNFSYPLNTNTFKLIIPKLYQLYPNCPMNLVAYTTKSPFIETTPSGVNLTIVGQAEAYVLTNGSLVYTFTIGLQIKGRVKIAVKGTNITGHVDSLKLEVSLVHSAIGNIMVDMKLLQFLLDAFADKIIVTKLNKYGDTGFPLPVIDGITLINTEVTLGEHFNLIATDVKYTPSRGTRREPQTAQDGETFAKITII